MMSYQVVGLRCVVPQACDIHRLRLLGSTDKLRARGGEEEHGTMDISPKLQISRAIVQIKAVWHTSAKLSNEEWIGQLGGERNSFLKRWNRKASPAKSNALQR